MFNLRLESFNLLWEELEAVSTLMNMRGIKRNISCLDEAEAGGSKEKTKDVEKKVVPKSIVTFRWILKKKDSIIAESSYEYLKYENCKSEGEDAKTGMQTDNSNASEGDEIEVECIPMEEEGFLQEALMEKVYAYLVKIEYFDRLKKKCAGCVADSLSQLDHTPGCVICPPTLQRMHARAAHVRVSADRLYEAASIIAEELGFEQGVLDRDLVSEVLDGINPWKCNFLDRMYEYEYRQLDEL